MDNSIYTEIAPVVAPNDGGHATTEIAVAEQVFSAAQWQHKIWPSRDAGPMATVMAEFIDWLLAEGYSPSTQRNHVRAAARLGSWMTDAGLGINDLDADRVGAMVGQDNHRSPKHRSANENVCAVVRFLQETDRISSGGGS